ncbi:ornithine cyclodeaminase family protein [Aliikangiella maris]|uniref:Ornithine cyclodeaminase family protein n=2 Tax=Aliikangiella maris TaxID=3162458 RepID=A0ABV3MT34_9GAMM
MEFIDNQTIVNHYDFAKLIDRLQAAFAESEIQVPMRHHHDFINPGHDDSTLLLMPAFEPGKETGVKMVTVFPDNGRYQLPSIQGLYLLFDGQKGYCKKVFDAKAITVFRTAATSAMASRLLSRDNSESLMMVGTGALSPMLIRAHATVRPIKQVYIWGRHASRAQAVKQSLADLKLEIQVVSSIEQGIALADIVSCATLSKTPLIKGEYLKPGQHIDMVGAYRPDMREADDNCLKRSVIFVDHYAGATKETGDIAIPLQKGIITRKDLKADLFELCRGQKSGRDNVAEITFFKSVGHALEDLVAAQLIDKLIEKKI